MHDADTDGQIGGSPNYTDEYQREIGFAVPLQNGVASKNQEIRLSIKPGIPKNIAASRR
jgi:hypothetical protein